MSALYTHMPIKTWKLRDKIKEASLINDPYLENFHTDYAASASKCVSRMMRNIGEINNKK